MTFSPCIEQIQRTCKVMEETGQLMDIRTMECLAKEYKIKEENLIIDLDSYHQNKSNGQSNKSKKRKEGEIPEEDHGKFIQYLCAMCNVNLKGVCSPVLSARTIGGKGHTGFITVARRIAK